MSQVATLTGLDRPLPETPVRADFAGDERRSSDPLDRLSRHLDDACTGAVDPLEIAAALESDGMTDSVARDRFGFADVFAVAEELHRRVPLRPVAVEPSRPHISRRCIGRGALFALPGLYFLALQSALSSRLATIVLVAVTIAGWALSQGISIVAHTIVGHRGRLAGLGFLRAVMGGTAVLGAATAGVGVATFAWPPAITLVAVALSAYVVAASVLVFLEADLVLAAVLLPGAGASAVDVAFDPAWLASSIVVGVLAGSVVATVVAALGCTRRGVRAGARPTGADLRRALPFMTYGAAAGTLVAAPLVAALGAESTTTTALALAMLPLTLSMGIAELQLRRHDRSARAALREEHELPGFARAALRSLWAATSKYAAWLAAIAIATLLLAALGGTLDVGLVAATAAYATLGIALFLGLTVSASGRVAPVTLALIGALGLFALLTQGAAAQAQIAFAITCGALHITLVLLASHDATRLVRHR